MVQSLYFIITPESPGVGAPPPWCCLRPLHGLLLVPTPRRRSRRRRRRHVGFFVVRRRRR
jgi:hypothetical protein